MDLHADLCANKGCTSERFNGFTWIYVIYLDSRGFTCIDVDLRRFTPAKNGLIYMELYGFTWNFVDLDFCKLIHQILRSLLQVQVIHIGKLK